jgi:hypothetical protein
LIGKPNETKFGQPRFPDGFGQSGPLPNHESKTCLLHCPEFFNQDMHEPRHARLLTGCRRPTRQTSRLQAMQFLKHGVMQKLQ